jgi:hypothetical protein
MSGQLSLSATEFLLFEEKLLSLLLAAFPPKDGASSDIDSLSDSEDTVRARRRSGNRSSTGNGTDANLPLAFTLAHEIMRKLRKRVAVSFVVAAKDEVRRATDAASSASSSSDLPSSVAASLTDIDEKLSNLKRSREELHSLVRSVPKRARVVIDGMLAEQYDVKGALADVEDSEDEEEGGGDDTVGDGGEKGDRKRKKRAAATPKSPLDVSVTRAAARLASKMEKVGSTLDRLEGRVALLAQATLTSAK